ncbi:MAG: dihydrofolate reductase [Bacteroidota bacterium]|nr:dihydrofolate reductase [Bacteroidota bacterium]
MRVILVFVSSLDGKVTKWDDPFVRSWSSQEDQAYFSRIWNDSRLIVMGSSTFNSDPLRSTPERLVVVMTRNPEEYEKYMVPGHLEFTAETPAKLTSRLKQEGYDQMLLVGGPLVAASFLKEKLVNELWLTIEPKIFGTGKNIITGEKLDIELQLRSCERVNNYGTLITRYDVLSYRDA